MSVERRQEARAETPSRPRGPRRRRPLAAPRSIEDYLKGNSAPRYMQRLRDLENEYRTEIRRLMTAYAELLDAAGGDPVTFARRWRARARAWRFDRLNALVRAHNAWSPIEAELPMDPRTGDYRLVRGASYRRLELDAGWILKAFPPDPAAGPRIDPAALAPREPAVRPSAGIRSRTGAG